MFLRKWNDMVRTFSKYKSQRRTLQCDWLKENQIKILPPGCVSGGGRCIQSFLEAVKFRDNNQNITEGEMKEAPFPGWFCKVGELRAELCGKSEI